MKSAFKKIIILSLSFLLCGGVAYASGIFPNAPGYADNFPVGDSTINRQGNLLFGVGRDDGSQGNPDQTFNALGLHNEAADMQIILAEFHNRLTGDMEFAFARMGRREDGVNVTVIPFAGYQNEGILIFNKLTEYPDEMTAQNDNAFPVGGVYRVGTDIKIKI